MSTVNIKTALRAFQVIRDKGQKTKDSFSYNGISASSDFDGYTLYISNDYVTLTIYFHNKFDLSYSNKKELTTFLEKLEALGGHKNASRREPTDA